MAAQPSDPQDPWHSMSSLNCVPECPNRNELLHMEDVQNRNDERQIPIDQVGVCDLRYPITVLDRNHAKQQTIARLALSVSLPHHFKGTHMSRFIEVLDRHRGEVTMRTVPAILADLRKRLDAEKAQIHVEFPYFL